MCRLVLAPTSRGAAGPGVRPDGRVHAFVRLDGGTARQIGTLTGPLSGGSQTLTLDGLTGSTLQIEIHLDSRSGGYALDDVTVSSGGTNGRNSGTNGRNSGTGDGNEWDRDGWTLTHQDEFNLGANTTFDQAVWTSRGLNNPMDNTGNGAIDQDGYGHWGRNNAWGNTELGYNTDRLENV